MTTDQWVALIGQIGVGGVALLGMAWLFAKVVVPMAAAKAQEIVQALRDMTSEIRALRIDNTAEHRDIAASLGDISERIARLESIYDHRAELRHVAEGSKDMTETAQRVRRERTER